MKDYNGEKKVSDLKALRDVDRNIAFLTDEESAEVLKLLNSYTIIPPDEEKINNTIIILGDYLPRKQLPDEKSPCHKINIWERCKITFTYINKWHIVLSMLIYLAAIFFTVNNTIKNHYGTIFLLSPIPFLIGLTDIFKNRIEGMQELEMSLRINYKQWLLSKLFIIANFNVLLNFIYSIIMFNMNLTENFLRLTLYWCVPFLIISGIGLLLVAKVRGNYTSVTVLAFWFAVSEYVQSSESVIEWMKSLNLAIYVLAITISFIFLIYEVKVILIKSCDRGDYIEDINRQYI